MKDLVSDVGNIWFNVLTETKKGQKVVDHTMEKNSDTKSIRYQSTGD